ncbi:hypothetical protein DFJ73DRAFT_775057 [Zopfochytrium polystomum]|nr:hypothetical protein DFJ73DRAFT_775057 [Zopfochytrium polystomum]
MSQRTALHVSTPAATWVELPPELASFHAYCLHSSKQPEHHDLLMQISAEVADPSDRFSAFHETRLAWAKENLPLLLAKIDIGDDRLERMNGPATSLFLECRDLLERSSDSEDKGKITDAVSLLTSWIRTVIYLD